MANPVAIYSGDPAAQAARGGTASAQIIQIDVYRSGAGARFQTVDPLDDLRVEDSPQRPRFSSAAQAARGSGSSTSRRTGTLTSSDPTSDETPLEVGRRRAPASLAFAAQQIAQEGLSPGLHFDNYSPALAAYALAAQGPMLQSTDHALQMSV
jgi:hypothetical protein